MTLTNQLFYVQVKRDSRAPYQGTEVVSFGFGDTLQIPVTAGSFTEAIDRVQKAYGNRCTVLGVTKADSPAGMGPLL